MTISIQTESSEDSQLFLSLFKLLHFKISSLFPWNISNCECSKGSEGRERKGGQQIASRKLREEVSVKAGSVLHPGYGNRLCAHLLAITTRGCAGALPVQQQFQPSADIR